jgi:hypothetical protein
MKAKHVISELCETLEAALTWITQVERHLPAVTHYHISERPVKTSTLSRRISKTLKVAYRECGYADIVRINRATED